MLVDEAAPSATSQIAWVEGKTKESLESFLKRNPPSSTRRAPGGDAWIWVRSARRASNDNSDKAEVSYYKAKQILEDLGDRLKEIDENNAIPRVKSSLSGPSKKMLRDAACKKCEEELRQIGRADWTCGKWMFFESATFVDRTFAKLAESIIDGPLSRLSSACCDTVKAAAFDPLRVEDRHGKGPQQLICLYFEDFWNADHAREVLECIVKEHGLIPSSGKADLYTMIGLDKDHPSKIRPTLYRPGEIFNWEQMREWQTGYNDTQKALKQESNSSTYSTASRSSNATSIATTVTTSSDQPDKEEAGVASRVGDGVEEVEDIRTVKARKIGHDDQREPIDPNKFWPLPSEEKKEKVKLEETTSLQKTAEKSKKVAPTAAEDDSETESESDYLNTKPAEVAVPAPAPAAHKPSTPPSPPEQASSSSSAKMPPPPTTPSKATAYSPPVTPTAMEDRFQKEPMSSIERGKAARALQSPKDKIKETPVVVLRSKKRDRFGRSDF